MGTGEKKGDAPSAMVQSPRRLVDAVSQAIGYDLNPTRYEDMLIIQKGVYILNTWGVGPMYEFSTYIEGPYSMRLANDCRLLPWETAWTGDEIPKDVLSALSRRMVSDDTYVSKSYAINDVARRSGDLRQAIKEAKEVLDRLTTILNEYEG